MAKKEFIGSADLLLIFQLLDTEFAKYVKVVEGKGLSANDFTDALKNKLVGIDLSTYAPLNNPSLTGIPTAPTPTNNDTKNRIATTDYVTTTVAAAISEVTGIKFLKVESLPTTGQEGIIYLVPKATAQTGDAYDEYYWTGTAYEFLGTTAVDLSGYLKETDVAEISQADVKAAFESVFPSTTTAS